MTEENGNKPGAGKLTLGAGRLTLKSGTPMSLRGSASSKIVQVEVRKKRSIGGAGGFGSSGDGAKAGIDAATAAKLKLIAEASTLDERRRLEEEARAAERARLKEIEEAEARAKAEREEAERRDKQASAPAAKKPSDKASAASGSASASVPAREEAASASPFKAKKSRDYDDEDDKPAATGGKSSSGGSGASREDVYNEMRKKVMKSSFEVQRRSGKLNVNAMGGGEDDDYGFGGPRRRFKRKAPKVPFGNSGVPADKVFREVVIPEAITVQELANRMTEKSADVIKRLMALGVMATINQPIDADTAQIIVEEMGHTFKRVAGSDVEVGLGQVEDSPESLQSRPPVVTVMGHVDHGKTSLLDALREANVVAKEAGGITQHIGAYQITVRDGEKITFIDTPGHEAFSEMRARGAKVTDIVVLVVAANDGIMPQTVEAIRHAQAASVPIVVAINKIDLPGADPLKVKSELLGHGIAVEGMGGEVLFAEVSAKKRIGLDKLVEAILLQAEMLDLKANPDRAAEGVVVEAKMEKGRGSVATVLVQKGTLRIGDICIAGKEWGHVRAMFDEHGKKVLAAVPSRPVEVVGMQGTPQAGDDFIAATDETQAREVTGYRIRKERDAKLVKSAKSAMEQMLDKIKSGETKTLPVIIKADVQGSIEAIEGTIKKLSNDEVSVQVLHSAVGPISESDISLAKASHAFIIGFNVRANPHARDMARRDGVDIRYYSIIYNVADDVKKGLEGLLSPELREKIIGYAEIRKVFNITGVGKVAGCMVTEGFVRRGAKVRLLRDNVVIHDGSLGQLKRAKDDVKEVKEGFECGMSFENYNDIQEKDMIECYEVESISREL